MHQKYLFPVLMAASLWMIGCESDYDDKKVANDQPTVSQEDILNTKCSETKCADDGITLKECKSGTIHEKDCSKYGQVCHLDKCLDQECGKSVCADDGFTLKKCVDGFFEQVDCSATQQICRNGACITPECTETKCDKDGITLLECENFNLRKVDCSRGDKICKNNTCEEKPKKQPQCKKTTCDEDGFTLNYCLNGVEFKGDCRSIGMICVDGDCVSAPCTDGERYCDKKISNDGKVTEILKTCEKGVFKERTCNVNSFCSDSKVYDDGTVGPGCEPKDCEEDSENQTTCADLHTLNTCKGMKYVQTPCGDKEICSFDHCKPDPCAACKEGQICVNDQCLDEFTDNPYGLPCKCESADCNIYVTNTDLKGMITPLMMLFTQDYLDMIGPEDNIVIPNFFSDSIQGCDALKNVVPEGMKIGCFRDSSISFPPIYYTLISEEAAKLLKSLAITVSPTLEAIIEKLSNLFKNGFNFTSPNGYCMTGAMEFSGKVTVSPMTIALKEDALAEGGFVDKLKAGDHETVVAKSAEKEALGQPYCPEGSEFFSFSEQRNISKLGEVNLGLDLCLQSCTTNEDCREGYDCLDLPTKLMSNLSAAPTQKACFNQDNADVLFEIMGKLSDLSH